MVGDLPHKLPFPGGRRDGNRLAVYGLCDRWLLLRTKVNIYDVKRRFAVVNDFHLVCVFLSVAFFRLERPACARRFACQWFCPVGCEISAVLLRATAFGERIARNTYICIDDGLFKRKVGQGERRWEESKGGKQENREAVAKGQADVQSYSSSTVIRWFSCFICILLCAVYVCWALINKICSLYLCTLHLLL